MNNKQELVGIAKKLLSRYPSVISNRGKKNFACQVAILFKLGFIETTKIAKSCNTDDTRLFLFMFGKKLQKYLKVSDSDKFHEIN